MTLAKKREVIELLLCGWRVGCYAAGHKPGGRNGITSRAVRARARVVDELTADGKTLNWELWELAAIEAAYRLIKSSPTLVREWFGRSAP